ncbi:FecR family protein, partial [Butyricimonas faecihominis]
IEEIIIKRLSEEHLSEEESAFFDKWYQNSSNREYYNDLLKIRSGIIASQVKERIDKRKAWNQVRPARKISLIRTLLKFAAIMILPLSLGVFLLIRENKQEKVVYAEVPVQPGKKQAVLTLSSGQQVMLADTIVHVNEKGMVISNFPDKELVYKIMNDTMKTETIYNTVTVPRGGEYKLVLADGTIVWLNSDSHIRYPVTFSGNTRQVELEGEAYFEVAKDVEKPFIVRMNEYNVRVTGTQFNVRNYSNESLATTLVEGGVQIERKGKVDRLRPGQQAVLENNEIRIRVVNVEEQVAWRHGAFGFTQCRLENIMEELARWYDVDVFYMNQQVKDYHFSAWFKRSSSINEVINILEKTKKISLDLKGRILTVKDISRN